MLQKAISTDVAEGREGRMLQMGWVWRSALAIFILAGSTGAFYRLALTYGWTAGFDLVNIRHAHSHLMYFGWVTPALFALMARRLAVLTGDPLKRRMHWILGGCFAAALLSYPLFLLLGYTPVAIGSKRIPIAVIGSTFNMGVWYAFVLWYIRASKRAARTHGRLLWDVAVTFLMLATLGAGGLALLKPFGIHSDILTSALTHVFLDFFSEGWFVLGVLGLAYHTMLDGGRKDGYWSIYPLCLGLPLTFALGMPSFLVPPVLEALARIGGVLVGMGLMANVIPLWRASSASGKWLWRIPLVMLALKASAQMVGGLVSGVWWADFHGARILYLHLMLLGFVSLGLVAAAVHIWGRDLTRCRDWMYTAVVMVLASLVPLSPLWPASLGGRWAYELAASLSFAPVAGAAIMLILTFRRSKGTPEPESLESAWSTSPLDRLFAAMCAAFRRTAFRRIASRSAARRADLR
jgi:hypothetical protein